MDFFLIPINIRPIADIFCKVKMTQLRYWIIKIVPNNKRCHWVSPPPSLLPVVISLNSLSQAHQALQV